jgi:sugar/nucleoside kinase (ribokinase family)
MFLVIGTTTADLFITGFERLPRTEGDEFTVDSLAFCDHPLRTALGGNGAISAYALARLGAPVILSTAVGNDWLGDLLTRWLHGAGVHMAHVARRTDAATASTVMVSDDRRNRLSFHHPGANETLVEAEIPIHLIGPSDALLLTSYPLLNRLRPQGSQSLMKSARHVGAITALDLGPAIGQPALLSELRPLLPYIDYLFCNEHELSVCTEIANFEEGMARVIEMGAVCVILKRGAQGAVVWPSEGEPIHVPGFAVDAKSTVGAGDSFNAGFLYALRQDPDPIAAARFANAVASLLVSADQGALGAPKLAKVIELLKEAQ